MSTDSLLRFAQALEENNKEVRPCPYVRMDERNQNAANLMWMGLQERLSGFIAPYIRDVMARVPQSERSETILRAMQAIQSDEAAAALGHKRGSREGSDTPQVKKTPLKPNRVPRKRPPQARH